MAAEQRSIPAKYNTETTLGQQVAPDDPAVAGQAHALEADDEMTPAREASRETPAPRLKENGVTDALAPSRRLARYAWTL